LKNNDPCPSIVLEALATGLPVIYCNSGGTPELVGDAGVAIQHPASLESPDEAPPSALIASAILQGIKARSDLSVKARRRAEQFRLADWYGRHEAVMHTLLEPSHHG